VLSLDSLRHTKIASAIRRETGKVVPKDLLKRAATLGELLDEIGRLPEEPRHAPVAAKHDPHREYAVWGMMWRSRCQWLFRRSRPLSEAALRVALEQLIDRHVALRAELRDAYRLFGATQQALTVFELWRRHGAATMGSGFLGRFACGGGLLTAALGRAAQWSFRNSWPRARAGGSEAWKGKRLPLRVLGHCATEEEAERKVWPRATEFVPPFQARFVTFGKDKEEGALVHLAVTHMLSDGYSVVPLLDDLSHLVACAEPGGTSLLPLPPVPSMFAVLEPRLLRTIDGDYDKDMLPSGITPEVVGSKVWHESVCVFARMPVEVVAAVRRVGRLLTIPDDIAMLAIVGITLAWLEDRESEPVSMIVPQRDAPGESESVGLFADVRDLIICTGGLSYAGVALRLHHVIKERLWGTSGISTQFDLALINFEWTDFTERHGFIQRLSPFEGGAGSHHPVRISVDQPGGEEWRVCADFDKHRFGPRRRERFFEYFETALRALLERPLDLVWPEGQGQLAALGEAPVAK